MSSRYSRDTQPPLFDVAKISIFLLHVVIFESETYGFVYNSGQIGLCKYFITETSTMFIIILLHPTNRLLELLSVSTCTIECDFSLTKKVGVLKFD